MWLKNNKGEIKMELVILGTAVCVIAVMIIAYMVICLVNEGGNANTVFVLILGIVLTAFFA